MKTVKTILLAASLLLVAVGVKAQQKGWFRGGIEIGPGITNNGGGLNFALEGKYNIQDNMNIGLRSSFEVFVKNITTYGPMDSGSGNETTTGTANIIFTMLPTYDYYLTCSGAGFRPFVGGGAGLYMVGNKMYENNWSNNSFHMSFLPKFGGFLRAGIEWKIMRASAEYNFVPRSRLQDVDGSVIGKSSNSFFALNLGVFLGGGKCHKK